MGQPLDPRHYGWMSVKGPVNDALQEERDVRMPEPDEEEWLGLSDALGRLPQGVFASSLDNRQTRKRSVRIHGEDWSKIVALELDPDADLVVCDDVCVYADMRKSQAHCDIVGVSLDSGNELWRLKQMPWCRGGHSAFRQDVDLRVGEEASLPFGKPAPWVVEIRGHGFGHFVLLVKCKTGECLALKEYKFRWEHDRVR